MFHLIIIYYYYLLLLLLLFSITIFITEEAEDAYDFSILPPITEEDKFRAMLGYKTSSTGAMAPYLWREV